MMCFFTKIEFNPEVIGAVQEEIDNITGMSRISNSSSILHISGDRGSVTLDDRPNLPYTEATLMEVGQFYQNFVTLTVLFV